MLAESEVTSGEYVYSCLIMLRLLLEAVLATVPPLRHRCNAGHRLTSPLNVAYTACRHNANHAMLTFVERADTRWSISASVRNAVHTSAHTHEAAQCPKLLPCTGCASSQAPLAR